MNPGRIIRGQIKVLEAAAEPLNQIRELAKTEGGRLTEYGKDFIAMQKKHGVKQSQVARMLDISAGAVSQHYNK